MITISTTYDMLLDMELLFPLGFGVDTWHERAAYHANWEEVGSILEQILLDLHAKVDNYVVLVLSTIKARGVLLEAL